MRYLTVLLLACLLSTYNIPTSFAQEDTEALISSKNTKKDSVFSRASDTQIKETQRYYKKCKNNETLSKRKDCKCAATTYLETKLRLGDDATAEQILAENVNTCLKDEETAINNIDRLNLDDVTEKDILEAEAIQNWCDNNQKVRTENDCECVAAKYLEVRVNEGPILGKDTILARILTPALCKNMVESTGSAYSTCMEMPDYSYQDIEPRKYCECFARKWAEYYKNHTGKLGSKTKGNYKYYSRMYCLNPNVYQ